jgi:hypothetical protein
MIKNLTPPDNKIYSPMSCTMFHTNIFIFCIISLYSNSLNVMLNITTAKTRPTLISTNFQKTMVQFNNASFDTNTAGLREQRG